MTKAVLLSASKVRKFLPPRPKSANKGQFGRVFILAGSKGMSGAAVLSAGGALRSGAGLIRVGTPISQQPIVARKAPPEIMTVGFPETAQGRLSRSAGQKILKSFSVFSPDVVALGPGLGQDPGVRAVVKQIFVNFKGPLVMDADALNNMARNSARWPKRSAPWVVTPHPGEMARLLKKKISEIQSNRVYWAREYSLKMGAVCLLKGAGTIIADQNRVVKNTTGNSGMATGGSGDVLTGLLAGIWAQYGPNRNDFAFEAAASAAFIHGMAGDVAAREKTERAMIPSDIISFIPMAYRKLGS